MGSLLFHFFSFSFSCLFEASQSQVGVLEDRRKGEYRACVGFFLFHGEHGQYSYILLSSEVVLSEVLYVFRNCF